MSIKETFEDYIKINIDQLEIDACRIVIECSGIDILLTTIYETVITQKYGQNPKWYYKFILQNILSIMELANMDNDEQLKYLLTPLIMGFYEIDINCGIDEWVTPKSSKTETNKIIKLLDEDRIKFNDLFITNYNKIDNELCKKIYLQFCRLIFNFNGYQAPFRLSAKKATQDAMGLTDLFGEYLESLGIAE